MKMQFSIEEVIAYSWKKVQKHFGLLIGAFALYALIVYVPNIIAMMFGDDGGLFKNFFELASIILSFALQMGLITIYLSIIDDKQTQISDLFSCFNLLPKYILFSFLYTLIVLAGLILLIVPGIIWSIKYLFYPYILVEEGLDCTQALKKSAIITEGYKNQLFLLLIVLFLINVLGMLAFMVGLFVTLPLSYLAIAYVYRILSRPIINGNETDYREL